MAKARTTFVCQECGAQAPKWIGRCPECGKWDTMVEERQGRREEPRRASITSTAPQPISSVETVSEPRVRSSIGEFDRILGGGVVVGSTVLIGGDPGIGKSTLLLQVCEMAARCGHTALYVSGEESVKQTKLRAQRLGVSSEALFVVAETSLDVILEHIGRCAPDLVVVDSIQMIYKQDLHSAPGSVSQVRECGAELVYLAKRTGIPVFLIGHVTKDGAIAGPRVLEHMVDAVLYFEGDKFHTFRMLRAVKNRFGSTNEIGIFEMHDTGLQPVANPSDIFLSKRSRQKSGSVVVPCIEGTRAFLIEIQALVATANFGTPERRVSGADRNRISMLIAVLEKRAGLQLGGCDTFVNVVGGVRIDEPAADLGIALAMASSFQERLAPNDMFVIGEVGLAGEVRPVGHVEMRIREGRKLGFRSALIPIDNAPGIKGDGLEIIPVETIEAALDRFE
ncbi:MAG: DNA repair protein RadA [Planctomycetes bacterium]|nr:DNA repair protein RadA [Planctomycetota bacterium]